MNFHIPLLLLASVLVILVIAESTHLEAENLGDYSLEASERACRRVRQPCDKKRMLRIISMQMPQKILSSGSKYSVEKLSFIQKQLSDVNALIKQFASLVFSTERTYRYYRR
uniref:U26-Deinotoxin-Dsu1c_1 n=1 Tax=Deinopis subrufa TaxID=1905329 RepID=A0A4Q8KDS9_DEISU